MLSLHVPWLTWSVLVTGFDAVADQGFLTAGASALEVFDKGLPRTLGGGLGWKVSGWASGLFEEGSMCSYSQNCTS